MATINGILKNKRSLIPVRYLRILTAVVFILLVLAGGFGLYRVGSPSAFEIFGIQFVCPLAYLQMVLAKRSLLPRLLVSFVMVTGIIILFGRIFCAWMCPTSLVRSIFSKRATGNNANGKRRQELQQEQLSSSASGTATSYAVLGGALASSLIFGFPVFCLVCPVGLFFGTAFALIKLFTIQRVGWELLVFPLIFVVEVFVLKSGCIRLCPLGALQRILASLNPRFFRPTINKDVCLRSRNIDCQICLKACPENINLAASERSAKAGCTNCLECVEKCPVNSISVLPKKVAAK